MAIITADMDLSTLLKSVRTRYPKAELRLECVPDLVPEQRWCFSLYSGVSPWAESYGPDAETAVRALLEDFS